MDLPEWLVSAVDQLSPGAYPFRETEEFQEILDGDILLVGGMDRSEPNRLVAVLEVVPDRRCFLGAPVTNELGMATAEDVVLESEHTGLPYRAVVMSGLARHLWFVQVDERLGALSGEALEAAVAGYYGAEDDFLTAHRGVPLQEPMIDMRWTECEKEVDRIATLSRDCINKWFNEELELPYVDPRLLPLPSPYYNGNTDTLVTLEADTRAGRTLGFSPSCVEQVAGLLDYRILRAYPTLFQARGSVTSTPPTRGEDADLDDWLLELTMADARDAAPFVKMIGASGSSGPAHMVNHPPRSEFLYETVGATSR